MPLRSNVHVTVMNPRHGRPDGNSPRRPLSSHNTEPPTANRRVTDRLLQRKQILHQQRLAQIATRPPERTTVGNVWLNGSRPEYSHLKHNLKGEQLRAERFAMVERENQLLLHKMTAMVVGTTDPTEGTWEFAPGVRLNRHQLPVTDHGISHMPQRGAARESVVSLNTGARRRELQRITHENRGIMARLQERGSVYPRSHWVARSLEHDRHLARLARPRSSQASWLPTPSQVRRSLGSSSRPGSTQGPRGSRPGSRPGSRSGLRVRSPGGGSSYGRPVDAALLRHAVESCVELVVGMHFSPLTAVLYGSGVRATVEPGAAAEETLDVADVLVRRDGLVLLLGSRCRRAHPAGSVVRIQEAFEAAEPGGRGAEAQVYQVTEADAAEHADGGGSLRASPAGDGDEALESRHYVDEDYGEPGFE